MKSHKIVFFGFLLISMALFMGACEDGGDNHDHFDGLVVASVTTGPTIDGSVDAVWSNATEYVVTVGESADYSNAFGAIDVSLKALQDGEYVYILASWADATENVDKKLWTYSAGSWSQSGNEDRIYFMWDTGTNGTEGVNCSSMCHVGDNQMYTTGGGWVDVWHWKAHRTNPLGHADDKYFNDVIGGDGGRHGDLKTIGLYSDNKDNDLPKYSGPITDGHFIIIQEGEDETSLTAFTAADTTIDIPGYILNENADGSRADVEAKGVWNNGKWTVELKRMLDTGNSDDDAVFIEGQTIQATIAVTNNSGGDHSGAMPFEVKF